MRISPGSFSVPTDVTLKLPEGNIDAHKMILAAVSPVFERMFYGDFKEGKSNEVSLPSDTWNTMKLLIDFVYNGKCEVNMLHDILPLLEVIDRYQINVFTFQHVIGEAVLAKLDPSNYLILLPKFASVISDEANKKAAEKVMTYNNNDITKSISNRLLPEEVLFPLIQTFNLQCYDIEMFDFLLKWYEYQKRSLGRPPRVTAQLFNGIRYSLIIPQILISKVLKCDLVDKQLVSKAIYYIYNSVRPLGEYNDDDDDLCKLTSIQCLRLPEIGSKIEWIAGNGISVARTDVNQYCVSGTCGDLSPAKDYRVVKSRLLNNGIYSFSASGVFVISNGQGGMPLKLQFSITKSATSETHLYTNCLNNSNLVTLYIYGDHLFVKYIANQEVVSTFTATVTGPLCIHMFMNKRSMMFTSSGLSFRYNILVYRRSCGI